MYCVNCGNKLDDRAVICPHCGTATANMYKMQAPSQTAQTKNNPLAITGFSLSLASIVFSFINGYLFFIVSVTALVLSIIGLVKSKSLNSGKGLSIAGIIISAVVLVFYILIAILAVIFAFSLLFLLFIPFA